MFSRLSIDSLDHGNAAGLIQLGQHCFGQWLVSWWPQAIAWLNVDTSVRTCGTCIRKISVEISFYQSWKCVGKLYLQISLDFPSGQWADWIFCVERLPWKLVIRDSKVHGANMGPTWVLSAPGGSHVGPMNLAIWDANQGHIKHGTDVFIMKTSVYQLNTLINGAWVRAGNYENLLKIKEDKAIKICCSHDSKQTNYMILTNY